jgi:hypothetical protein
MASCSSIGGYEIIIPRRAIDPAVRVVFHQIIQSQSSVNTNSSSKHPSFFASISRKDGSIQDRLAISQVISPPPHVNLIAPLYRVGKGFFDRIIGQSQLENINYVTDNKEVVIASIGVTMDPSTC